MKLRKAKKRVTVIKALPYKGCMVYLRRIGKDYFEYLVVFADQVYSSYWIIEKKGNLTKNEVREAAALTMAGAMATIDFLLGEKLDKKSKGLVKTFEKTRKVIDKASNKVLN